MAIAWRNGTTAGNSSGTDVTINKPTNTADGDILIAVTYREAGTWTLPSGWAWVAAEQASYNSSAKCYVRIAWKRASSEPASWTFTFTPSGWRVVAIGAFSGITGTGNPVDVSAGNALNQQTQVAATITTSNANEMCVACFGNYNGYDVVAGSSGYTVGVNLGGCAIAYLIKAAAGATGAKNFSDTADNGAWATYHIALLTDSGGNPSPSVTDSVTGAETVTVQPLAIARSVSDAATAGESVTVQVASGNPTVSVSDAAAVGETVTLATAAEAASVSDSVTLSESVAVGIQTLSVNVSDAATTAESMAVNLPTDTSNWSVSLGANSGYTDVSPKQLVRTKGNRLYAIVSTCDNYPGTTTANVLHCYRANSTGLSTAYTLKDSANAPSAVGQWAIAIDANDLIHVIYNYRTVSDADLAGTRYITYNTSTDTWGSYEQVSTGATYNIGQGDEAVSIDLDSSGVPHVVYLEGSGAARRVYYRNRSGGTWSSATQIDSGVTYSGNYRAWHCNLAFDPAGRILAVWGVGQFNGNGDTTFYSRVYSGSWGSTVQASATAALETGIDNGASILITPDGRYHITHIDHNSDHSLKYIKYRYSDDQGATWSSNNPTNQATHNPSLGYISGKVRIYGHGAPDSNNHGNNLYYLEGNGGSGAWGSWTQFVTGTNYDSSINVRWSQYNWNYPHTLDLAYWDQNYPSVLYIGTGIYGFDVTVSDAVTTAETVTVTLASATAPLVNVSDAVTPAETVTASMAALRTSVTDAITAGETATIAAVMTVSVTDTATLSESATPAVHAKWQNADALTLTKGAISSGTLADTWSDNNIELVLTEQTGTPGFDYSFSFYNVVAAEVRSIALRGYYEGNASHNVKLYEWNFTGSSWTALTGNASDLPSAASEQLYSFTLFAGADYISGNELRLRIDHTSAGNPTHLLHIDELVIQSVPVISVSDAATVSEAVTASASTSAVSVTDAATGAETVTVAASTSAVNVSDAATLAETVTAATAALTASVTDLVTGAETVGALPQITVILAETITAGEAIDIRTAALGTDVTDAAVIGEMTQTILVTAGVVYISVNDGVSLGETVTAGTAALTADVTEAAAVGEAVAAQTTTTPAVADASTVDESVTVIMATAGVIYASASDDAVVGETITMATAALVVIVTDTTTGADDAIVTAGSINALAVNVADAAVLDESLGQATTLADIQALDAITVGDAVEMQHSAWSVDTVTDGVTVGELIALSFTVIGMIDVTVGDYAVWRMAAGHSAVWDVALGDATRT